MILNDFRIYQNNLIVSFFIGYTIIEYKGKNKEIYYNTNNECYFDHSFSNNNLLILSNSFSSYVIGNPQYNNMQLYLIKEPYNEISKTITVEITLSGTYFEIIGLKDCLVYINFDVYDNDNGNVTYKIYDYNLNHINTHILKYENIHLAEHTEISENGKFNEFILCIHYIGEDQLQCQMIKYRNKTLLFSEKINIYYPPKYSFLINIFDENKIRIYFYYDRLFIKDNNYINILQYENQNLSFYASNIILPELETHYLIRNDEIFFTMTEQGLGVLTSDFFCYLATIYLKKILLFMQMNYYISPLKHSLFLVMILLIFLSKKKVKI